MKRFRLLLILIGLIALAGWFAFGVAGHEEWSNDCYFFALALLVAAFLSFAFTEGRR